jgi:hypothetical protein
MTRSGVGSAPDAREEVTMASQSTQPATNERIVRLLEELQAQIAENNRLARELLHALERR